MREIRPFSYYGDYSILYDYLHSGRPAAQLCFERLFKTALGRQVQGEEREIFAIYRSAVVRFIRLGSPGAEDYMDYCDFVKVGE